MNKNLVNKVGSVGQDNLIAKLEPKALTFGVKIPALSDGEVTLPRGTLLGLNSAGKYEVYGERETKTQKFNGDGTTVEFTVSDKPASLVSVAVGGTVVTTGYTYAAATGKITFSAGPAAGSNNVVATYYVWHTSDRTPAAILADDVTVTAAADATAVAYRCGNFNRSAVLCGEGYSLTAADEDVLRKYDIIFTDVM